MADGELPGHAIDDVQRYRQNNRDAHIEHDSLVITTHGVRQQEVQQQSDGDTNRQWHQSRPGIS